MPIDIVAAASVTMVITAIAIRFALTVFSRAFSVFINCIEVRFRHRDMRLCSCARCVEGPVLFHSQPPHIKDSDKYLLKY